jgi:hypothetical protein
MAKQPTPKPEPVQEDEDETEVVDTRSELQKQEEAEAAEHDALPIDRKIAKRLDELLKRLDHQVKHNAPVGPALVQEIRDIRALIG